MKQRQKAGYDGNCRRLSSEEVNRLESSGQPYTIRLKVKF